MNRRVFSNKYATPHDARLGITPETAGDGQSGRYPFEAEAEATKKLVNGFGIDVRNPQYVLLDCRRAQIPDNWIITIRTRSSAIASRNTCSSFSLPSTRVSSHL